MWIKELPKDYSNYSSSTYGEVFLWKEGIIYVMDNHKSALWCWLQECKSTQKYNFMHIDRHYDMLECFKDADLEPLKKNPTLTFDEYSGLMQEDRQFKVFRWDNFIMAGYTLYPDWFHTNIFLTQKEGNIGKSWGHTAPKLREEDPLYMDWCIRQYIGEPAKNLDGFQGRDYRLKWIVSLDLDVFYTKDDYHIQLFSDDYIRRIAEILNKYQKKIAVLTIALSPDCLGGNTHAEKWDNGFRILKIMSEKMEPLKGVVDNLHL